MILSICIPSFNRFSDLKKNLESICLAKSKEFDVIVVDNGSSDDIFDLTINDERIKIIKRDEVVPGPVNVRTCLDYADAKYCMICLDKDLIRGEYLDGFIENLRNNSSIACGYCHLNSDIPNGKIKINYQCIEESIYRCGHPSGYFFRRDTLVIADHIEKPSDERSVFYNNPFAADLLYAVGLLNGNEGVFDGSLIITETPEKSATVKSYSYSSKKQNIYFIPENRKKQFEIFLIHLDKLAVNKKRIVKRLYFKTLMDCTFSFRDIMGNEQICAHHSLQCVKITKRQVIKEAMSASLFFISSKKSKISRLCRIQITIVSDIKFVFYFLKQKVKGIY